MKASRIVGLERRQIGLGPEAWLSVVKSPWWLGSAVVVYSQES